VTVVECLGDHGCEYMTKGLVIVLGKTGRNFAAGMSGGIAFVLDEDGKFEKESCNKASVDLEKVFDPQDQQLIHQYVSKHFELTESPRAKRVLDNWLTMVPRFVKIFPHEYKRVLSQIRKPVAAVVNQPLPVVLHG
jgi:glutamate synthase domain-containing protein 3